MKKLVIPLFIVIVISCQQDELLIDKPQVVFEKVNIDDLNMITKSFVPLSEVAWDFANSDDLRKHIYSKVEDKFDGDFNVLFRDIIDSEIAGRSAYSELINALESGIEIYQSMVNDEVIHPQIFIPFYEELYAQDRIGIQSPVLVFRDGPPPADGLYTGYEYFENDLYSIGKISEEYAKANEVWVISTNERVDENGEVRGAYTNTTESGRMESFGTPKIVSVRVKGKSCMKEDWVGGKVDVWIQRHLTNTNSYPLTGFYLGDPTKDYSAEIVKISRSDAKNSRTIGTSFTVIANWDTNPIYYGYNRISFVIFEYDPSPAGIKTVDMGHFVLYYKSYEGYFVIDEHYQGGNTFSYSSCFESNMY